MSTTLPLFWDLSSADKKRRIGASVKLIRTLEKFQASYEHKLAESDASSNENGNDSSGEEDVQGTGAVGNIEHNNMLDSLNAPDVAYSVRRLVRGLASPRESSRLGFAVALTELLSHITTVSCAQILVLLLDATRISGNQTGQEERDLLFARLFGLTAIIHSGLLLRTRPPLPRSASAPSTSESCTAVLGALCALARAKSWLAESAYWAIGRAMDHLAAAVEDDVPWREEAVRNLFEGVFGEEGYVNEGGAQKSGIMWTPEKIALALRAQRLWPGREYEWRRLWAPTIKYGDVLHPANLATLAKVLKESEHKDEEGGVTKIPGRAWRPQVHHVWDELLDDLLPPDGSGRSPATSFQEFFRIVVDESLFSGSASNERKYWGFVVFQRALPRVKAADLPMLFTRNFMRTWINHLSHFDRYLHSFAKQIAKEIISVVEKDPTLGFAFILQLTGVHGNQQFDKLTKTKTIESMLTKMNAIGIKKYISHLLEQVDGGSTSEQSGTHLINARRSWIIEQLAALIRNGAIPKSDDWVQMILDWFIIHGIFIVKKSKKSSISAARSMPSPPYSDQLRRQCRERLLGCLADLTQLSAVTKTAETTQKTIGTTLDGQLWVSSVVQMIQTLEQGSKNVALLSNLGQDDRRQLEHARETVSWLRNILGGQREQAEGVELLLQSCVLQIYIGDNSGERVIASLESCVSSAIRLFPTSPEKPDVLDSPGDCDVRQVHEPIDVLVDSIIGYLEKGTAFLRAVGNRSFTLLSGVIKESTVNLILTQLERRDPSELLANSDIEGNTDDDGYSENDRDDDKSSTSVEESESDAANDEEMNSNMTETLQSIYIDVTAETADEESEKDLNDDQMMMVDDQLALMFQDRARKRRSKEGAQREAIHFKNRTMDLLDIFIRRQPTSPYILQFLVPLLALTFSDERQVSEKATGLLMSRIGKLKEVPSGVDVVKASGILNDLHIRARKVHSRDAVAIVSRCSLYVSRALLHVGADETVRVAYTASLMDFTQRKASDLNGQFFYEFIKRYPRAAWGMRAALLAAPMNAVNDYRQGQAYMLLETLLKDLIPQLPDVELDDVAVFIRELQRGLYSTLSVACDTTLKITSGIKEALKLVIVSARMTKRLVAQHGSFADIWEPTIWTELHDRLLTHDRFMISAALVGMCRQFIQLVQTQRERPGTVARECTERRGQIDEGTTGSKRKASAYSDVGITAKKIKRATAVILDG